MLFDDKIDVVVGNTDALPSCAGLDIDKIEEFQRGFFACAEHPLCGKEIVTTDDLAAYPVGATYPLPQVVIKTSSVRHGIGSVDAFFRVRSNHYDALLELMLSSDAVVFGSNIAYLRQVKVGQVVQLNVTPLFPADMQLTVVSIAGRAISPTAPLSPRSSGSRWPS